MENVFGIMASRFCILHTEMNIQPKSVRKMVRAIVILHNILNKRSGRLYIGTTSIDHEDAAYNVVPGGNYGRIETYKSRNARDAAKSQLDTLRDYFCDVRGAVPWQTDLVHSQFRDN